ncbi:MAG TPA: M14 family zinc carboxypeptidase [Fluviicola sp.]|nr:M14 family zinc carboxypeptidase [Fluviicola sp.]
MKTHFSFLFLLLISNVVGAQWSGNTTPTYPELIAYYQKLDREHPEIELYAMGKSDTDWPIYLCVINGAQDSVKTFEKARNNTTILINNAIHPGEPDGVNACLLWIDNWIKNGKKTTNLPVIAIIPAYNVGGMFNRSSNSRANQDGPEEYGFRGNSQNLDLNRDFIKMDSPNAFTFATIYHALDPDVFVDTHVSNGADYQYTLTYISSMKERMAPSLGALTYEKCIPALTSRLKKRKTDLFPYVELQEDIPDKGIIAFNDLPRYAMGYASLFHAISFTVETHMLKPFPQRVEATLQFLEELINWSKECAPDIELARKKAIDWSREQEVFTYNYKLTDKADSILFKGYKAIYKTSPVTGLERLFYDREQPYTKKVPHFQTYRSTDAVVIPKAYFVGGANTEVIARLKANDVLMSTVLKDSLISVTTNKVLKYDSPKQPYEGHFLHSGIVIEKELNQVLIPAGTVMISTDQPKSYFIVSVLEPAAEDSYFAWNFFDSYLQQKEYFSAYVFEEKAAEILENDPQLAQEFKAKKAADPAFANNAWDQLFFIYKRSVYYEKTTANRLPIWEVR